MCCGNLSLNPDREKLPNETTRDKGLSMNGDETNKTNNACKT
jgi:hypothetical protein